jgi:CheY-like chemotaxis protein
MSVNILYIEDNQQNFYLVKFILAAKGHEVSGARDGREGIAMALRSKPDLILLDIQLPGMDGYAVAREIRSNAALADIPLIALTSYAMAGDREKALEAGCDDYIEKPIDPLTFVANVEKCLPRGGAPGEKA